MATTTPAINELICRVFTTRNATHLEHWRTRSYSRHMALGSFYEDIIDNIDEIIECYQGNFGLIDTKTEMCPVNKDVIKHLKADVKWIADNRSNIAQNVDAIMNLIDELTATYLRTIYKLISFA